MRFYIYIFAFIFSLATTLLQRGVFFYAQYELKMGDSRNLILALAIGITYISGAQLSHKFWEKAGAKKTIFILLSLQMLIPIAGLLFPTIAVVSTVAIVYSFFNGMTWPVAESYAGAGLDDKAASKSIGIYNLCWSIAVPLSVWISGTIISDFGGGFFLLSSILILISFFLVFMLPSVIPHHEKPVGKIGTNGAASIPYEEMKGMLISSRWSMGFSYALMQILASLLPGKFQAEGFSVANASALAGFIDASRFLAFLLMTGTAWWHGRKILLSLVSILLSAGFCICMFGNGIPLILAGEIIYGMSAGFAYYSALYYAIVLSKASVGAGGSHESVIGGGFTAGPLLVLGGKQMALLLGVSAAGGLIFGVVPMILTAVPLSILYLMPKKRG
jgi:predicted MFS family arabinose efflux permease